MKFLNKLKDNSILFKDVVAYKVNNESITYEELWDVSNYYGDLLKREGTSPVIVYGNKSINILMTILACLIAKRSYVPIDYCTPKERIEQIIKDCSSSLMITDEEIDIKNIDVLRLSELDKYSNSSFSLNDNDVAYILFTSGSTGKPKGVQITYDNLDNFINWISNIPLLFGKKDLNVLNQASFSFDLSVADLYYALNNGHTLVSLTKSEQDNYSEIFKVVKDENINFIVSTPSFFKLCLLNNEFKYENFKSIECIYFCGEVLDKTLVKKIFERFPNIKIINAYGPTEATSAVSFIEITPDMLINEEVLPVGDMTMNATDIFLDNNEIVLKGKSISKGYLLENGRFYNEDGVNCFKTGDLGLIKNNKLYCLGRIDNQVKYMGYRIELGDIEENIKNILGVVDCVVIPKYDLNDKVKMLKAFVVLDECDITHIKEILKYKLPCYMMPKLIVEIDKIPINKNGKVDRKELSKL